MKPVRTRTVSNHGNKEKPAKDPIEVFCRIRPLKNRNEVMCIRAQDDTTVVTMAPETSLSMREVYYSFKHVFDEDTTQKALFDHVALPLIKDLFQGINGLLFTYGITSSGKTFTVAGTPQDPGILPRTLDVIFNSMKDFKAIQHVFKSDKANGFEIQSNAEAFSDRQKEHSLKNRHKAKEYIGDWNKRSLETTVVDTLSSDFRYAAFVSYVEIYNNYVYDLLEDFPSESYTRLKAPQSKLLRQDAMHNFYVFTTTEVEVQNADEALELFCKGQQRRKISDTALNQQSSRSHSVFTVRIAQAPLDPMGADVLQDKDCLTVSQFSIVDLAGSERQDRTKNSGISQREAGNINSSLMALRQCIEVLRENQKGGIPKMVPYRDSKLTRLFKKYFEGEGKICMIVCINPHIDEYNELTHVMRFAEVTKDVQISRSVTPVATPVHFRSGRGNLFREAVRRAKEENIALDDALEPVTYSLGPDFPPLTLDGPDDEQMIMNLIEFVKARKARRTSLIQNLSQRQDEFRQQLLLIEKDNASLKQENVVFQMDIKGRVQQVRDLERKLANADEIKHLMQQKLNSLEKKNEDLDVKLTQRDQQLEREKEKLKSKMEDKMQSEKCRIRRIMEKRLAEKQAELARKMCFNEEKFRQLRDILNSGDWEVGLDFAIPQQPPVSKTSSSSVAPGVKMTRAKTVIGEEEMSRIRTPSVSSQMRAKSDPHVDAKPDVKEHSATFKRPQKSIAVANPRHRRSHSSTGDVWLEHKPIGNLELGTVLQPKMKKKKSVSKLEVKDVTKDVSKYVLTHQEQDSQGEMETQLYKADVIPSAGGGAQVIFNDVEKLRQESPPPVYNLRKRSAENTTLREIEEKCTVSVECHGVPSKVQRKAK